MVNFLKKALSLLFCVTITASIAIGAFPLQKANAWIPYQLVSDPVTNVQTAATVVETIAGWVAEAWRFIDSTVLRVLLATLKKQLLDEITRETVRWVQNGEKPLFLQKPGKVFEEAADEAAGEVIQQIGGDQLCRGIPFNVNFYLSQPNTTKKQASCTLTQVVNNLESFKKDFKTGGWLGYTNLLQPQNNQYGIEILTGQALERAVAQKTQEETLKQNINLGFNSEICTKYQLISSVTEQPMPNLWNVDAKEDGSDPGLPYSFSFTARTRSFGTKTYTAADKVKWKCVENKTTTPGRTIAEGLNKSLGSNIDFIVNSDDLTNVLAAVLDAAFNRLVKDGVDGVKTGLAKLSSENTTGAGLAATTVDGAYDEYSQQHTGTLNDQIAAATKPLTDAEKTLNEASSTLLSASEALVVLFDTSKALLECVTSNGTSADIEWASSTIALATSTYPAEIAEQREKINGARTQISAIRSGLTQGSVPSQSQKNTINTALSSASDLKTKVAELLSLIQSNIDEARNRMTVCANGAGQQQYP